MLKNYLKIALRNLFKNKSISVINIAGLAFAVAFCLLIMLFVRHEFDYDRFQKNGRDIYRVILTSGDTKLSTDETTPLAMGPAIKKDFPEIKNMMRFCSEYPVVLVNGNQFKETDIVSADKNILEIFTFNFIAGSPEKALNEPNSVILSKELAQKYFGNTNPLGQTLIMRKKEFKVTGVYSDLPSGSSLRIRGVVSGASDDNLTKFNSSWGNNFAVTYVQLNHNADKAELEKKISDQLQSYAPDQFVPSQCCQLQPLNRIHLYSKADYGIEEAGDINSVIAYAAIALFMLVIASINFINISFGQIVSRFKEIGLRKMWGAGNAQISFQYFFEILISVGVSFLISIVLMTLFLPLFNQLAARKMEFVLNLKTILSIGGVFLFTGIIVGVIPSLLFAKYRISEILRGSLKFSGAGSLTKKLIVLQFSLAIFFMICTALMSKQIDYAMNLHRINDRTNIIEVSFKKVYLNYADTKSVKGLINTFISEAKKSPFMSEAVPVSVAGNYTRLEFEGKKFNGPVLMCSPGFLHIYDFRFKKGRDFNAEKYPADTVSSAVINETYAKMLNATDPVGKTFMINNNRYNIIGMIEDSPLSKIVNKLPEQLYVYNKYFYNNDILGCKILKKNENQAFMYLKELWSKYFTGIPFDASFYDEKWHNIYAKEINSRKLLSIVSAFTLIVSSFGIFGLVTLSLAKRKKEIGIRKVLGAPVTGIIYMIAKEFILLICISAVIASPFAYYFMNNWLGNFAYKTGISPYLFVASTAIVLLTAIMTVGIKSAKTALSNPVEAIKYE